LTDAHKKLKNNRIIYIKWQEWNIQAYYSMPTHGINNACSYVLLKQVRPSPMSDMNINQVLAQMRTMSLQASRPVQEVQETGGDTDFRHYYNSP